MICRHCAHPFAPSRPGLRFCSSACRIAHFDGLRRPVRIMVRAPRDPYPRRLPSAFSQAAGTPADRTKAQQAACELAQRIVELRASVPYLDNESVRDRLCIASEQRFRAAMALLREPRRRA